MGHRRYKSSGGGSDDIEGTGVVDFKSKRNNLETLSQRSSGVDIPAMIARRSDLEMAKSQTVPLEDDHDKDRLQPPSEMKVREDEVKGVEGGKVPTAGINFVRMDPGE